MLTFDYSTRNADLPLAYASFGAMHTSFEMLMVSIGHETAEQLANEVYALVCDLSHKLNRFDDRSALSVLNQNGGGTFEKTDSQLTEILELCQFFYASTKWYFDVAATSEQPLPYGAVRYIIDREAQRVAYADQGVRLDLGGFAKGYALDRVRTLLEAAGVERALINFGNSSVLALGRHPLGSYWPVGVEHTYRRGENARLFELSDGAMSMSGHTPQHRRHIRSPQTGEYVDRQAMVAVTGRSATIAEVLSTALFAAPVECCGEILSLFPGYNAELIECTPDGHTVIIEIE